MKSKTRGAAENIDVHSNVVPSSSLPHIYYTFKFNCTKLLRTQYTKNCFDIFILFLIHNESASSNKKSSRTNYQEC